MFAESTPLCLYERSIYNEHTFSRPFSPYSFPYLYYTIIYYIYIQKRILFPALTFCPAPFLPFPHVPFIIYTLYIERNILSATFYSFPALSYTFIILLIYRMIHTFPAPFLPFYKVNTFTPPLSLSF